MLLAACWQECGRGGAKKLASGQAHIGRVGCHSPNRRGCNGGVLYAVAAYGVSAACPKPSATPAVQAFGVQASGVQAFGVFNFAPASVVASTPRDCKNITVRGFRFHFIVEKAPLH
jgi:hypothetical protein